MEKNLKYGGNKGLDSDLIALQNLKRVTCFTPRRLTESEIKWVRQSKTEFLTAFCVKRVKLS